MLNLLKLSHPRHSGRLRPHEHTSYLPLCLLLAVVGFTLSVYSVSAASPGPELGSVGLSGTVSGPAPTVAATIQQPVDQQRFSISPITVSGTCPKGTLVEVFKNDIFAGSTICSDEGTYSLDIDLLIGKNILIVRVYNALNQPGPDSKAITVFYDALPAQAGPSGSLDFGAQLLINTDAVFRGVFPEDTMTMPIDIIGGGPPYAVNIRWGDSTNKVVPRNDNLGFNVDHIYKKPGVYQATLQASDVGGRVAFLTVAAIVNGQPALAAANTSSGATQNQLLVLWPLYTSAIAVVISFWLGERREKHILGKRGALLPTQG